MQAGNKPVIVIFLAVCLVLIPAAAVSPEEYKEVSPSYRLTFPGDFFYRKDYRVQWWYFTGHLYDGQGREFGYELTFFAVGVQRRAYRSKFGVENIYISHFAVSDIKEKRFFYSEKADSGAFGFAGASDGRLEAWVNNDRLEGAPDKIHIKAADGDKAIDLVLKPAKPLVLHGDRGYSRKSEESPLIASYYFSYTDLKTEGSLNIGGTEFRVHGKSWFDREMSTRGLGKGQSGWDWFAIQLDDGREIMLYMIRKEDGSRDRYSSGTLVAQDGSYRRLSVGDFRIDVLDNYKSGKSGARYPSLWEVAIPSESIRLRIKPLIKDQEFSATSSTGIYYWEGDCGVEGTAKGRAYVEMTGY